MEAVEAAAWQRAVLAERWACKGASVCWAAAALKPACATAHVPATLGPSRSLPPLSPSIPLYLTHIVARSGGHAATATSHAHGGRRGDRARRQGVGRC